MTGSQVRVLFAAPYICLIDFRRRHQSRIKGTAAHPRGGAFCSSGLLPAAHAGSVGVLVTAAAMSVRAAGLNIIADPRSGRTRWSPWRRAPDPQAVPLYR